MLTPGLVGLVRLYVDVFAALFAHGEYHYTVDECEESVVLAHAHVEAGVVDGATLTLDDVACLSELTAKNLDAESFAF